MPIGDCSNTHFLSHFLAVLEKLRLFLVVLEEGSLRRAAERLHVAQPAITRQLKLLEHELGGRLLERTSTGVSPTNGGHAVAEKAKSLLESYDSTIAELRRLVRGESERLRIGWNHFLLHKSSGLGWPTAPP
jgi:DNA-binding transcriptional LysR family regulator